MIPRRNTGTRNSACRATLAWLAIAPVRRFLGLGLLATGLVFFSPGAVAQVIGEPAVENQSGSDTPQPTEPEAPVVGEPAPEEDPIEQDFGPGFSPESEDERSGLDPFAAMLTRRGPSAIRLSSRQPQIYKTTEGDETFVFQTDGPHGFIRFPCERGDTSLECALLNGRRAEEVIILDANRSPRGDVTYSDQSGEAVLRVTANGGATLFGVNDTTRLNQTESIVPLGGRAVLPVNAAGRSLKAPSMTFAVAQRRMQRAADLLNQRHGANITFMARGVYQGDQAVLADAVLTAAKGIDIVSRDPLGARIIAERLSVVEFAPAADPEMALTDGVLTVNYNPAGGLTGRPSSIGVARYLESAL